MTQETFTQVERKQVQNWLRTLTNCRSNLFLKDDVEHIDKAMSEIKEALANHIPDATKMVAQPEQEPVAWMDKYGDVLSASVVDGKGLRNIPLYTTPPQRTWVWLSQEDFAEACQMAERGNYLVAFQRIQAKLKELNT
jgi:hypothetical protein